MKNMKFVSLVVLSLLVVSGAAAQFLLRGTIGGLVTDTTGAVIVDATVTLTDLDRNQASVGATNASGLFSFPNLVAGNYQISVEQPGFKTGVSDVVVITTNDNVRVDIGLQIGEVTETVEVTTAAPLIQTEQTVVGQVVDETLVEALPALGRNFLAFSTLAPNVSSFPRSGMANETWTVGSYHTIGGINVQAGARHKCGSLWVCLFLWRFSLRMYTLGNKEVPRAPISRCPRTTTCRDSLRDPSLIESRKIE